MGEGQAGAPLSERLASLRATLGDCLFARPIATAGSERGWSRRQNRSCVKRGCTKALIAVALENQPALSLYQRLGYAETGRDRGEWSYVDHQGRVCHVHEPSYVLEKSLISDHPTQ